MEDDLDSRRSAPRALALGVLLIVAALIAQIIGTLVGSGIAAAAGAGTPTADDLSHIRWAAGAIAFIAGELAIFALGAIVAVRVAGSLAAIGLRFAGWGRSFLLTWPILLLGIVLPLVASVVTDDHIFASGDDGWRVLLLVVATISIGLAEETVFRGALLNVLGGRAHPVRTVVGCALLFGLVHVPWNDFSDTGAIVNAVSVLLVVGVPFALIRLVSDNIVGLIVAHALFDFVGLLRLGSVDFDKPTVASVIYSITTTSLVAVGYVLWARRAFARERRLGGRARAGSVEGN